MLRSLVGSEMCIRDSSPHSFMLNNSGDRLDSSSPWSANGSPQKPTSTESFFDCSLTSSTTSDAATTDTLRQVRRVSRGFVHFLVTLNRADGRTAVIFDVLWLCCLLKPRIFLYHTYSKRYAVTVNSITFTDILRSFWLQIFGIIASSAVIFARRHKL